MSERKIFPARLKEARESRGLSKQDLAEAIEVTRQAVHQYETGDSSPSDETFSKILNVVDLPIEFFITSPRQESIGPVFWRSLKKFEIGERCRIQTRFAWLRPIIREMEDNFIDFPAVNFPQVKKLKIDQISDDFIEKMSSDLRSFWGLGKGPISNLTGLLETNGVFIARIKTTSENVDAVACWVSGKPIIIASEKKKIAVRFRFSLAHELGHLLLHQGIQINSKNLDEIERQANYFANSFLLPETSFSKEIFSHSLTHFTSLKNRWKVSIAAMIMRCRELKLLNENQAEYLWRQMATLGYRKLEPFDREMILEEPTLLNKSTKMILENGEDILMALKEYNKRDIEHLCQVPEGTLVPFSSNVIKLEFKNKKYSGDKSKNSLEDVEEG